MLKRTITGLFCLLALFFGACEGVVHLETRDFQDSQITSSSSLSPHQTESPAVHSGWVKIPESMRLWARSITEQEEETNKLIPPTLNHRAELRAILLSLTAQIAPPHFPLKSLLCLTGSDGLYLANQGNQSPAIRLHSPSDNTHSIGIWLFDLDHQPRPLSSTRLPHLLWTLGSFSPTLLTVPSGLGGRGFTIQGKGARSTRMGLPWLNDYTQYFVSELTRGAYFGYDGPCVRPEDQLKTHRVISIAIALPALQNLYQEPETPQSGWSLFPLALRVGIAQSIHLWHTPPDTGPSAIPN